MTSAPDPQPAVAAEPAVSTQATVAESAAPRGILEWFWRGKSLKLARAYRTQLPRVEHVRLRHALAALELADRAYDPVEPLRSGSSLGLSISLYREAVYFALLAQDERFTGPDLATLFRELPQDLLEFAAGGTEELRAVRLALAERDFVQTADLAQELLPGDAKVARDFAHALVRKKLLPEARVGSLLLQRGARSFGLTALFAVLLTVGIVSIQRLTLKPDLAEGKSWRASSALDVCKPKEHYCASARTDIFFCTLEEASPWVEIDLGKRTDFSRIDVTNRSDCCGERAAPLVAEVSDDQNSWREVARRKDSFSEWSTKFAPQKARYVRLRALRRTILHLEKVAVRAG